MSEALLQEIAEQLQKGKRKQVKALCEQAIEEGMDAGEVLQKGLLAGMDVIGVKFKANEIFVPQVLVAARAMKAGSEILKPHLSSGESSAAGKVVIGTVKGDLHDIGKNLVAMMMEGKGFEVIDLGVDVPTEKIIETAIDEKCDVICLSALLTTTMPVMQEVIEAAQEAGIRDQVKIMVGGAPVTKEFAESIGADAYAEDGPSAAETAMALIA